MTLNLIEIQNFIDFLDQERILLHVPKARTADEIFAEDEKAEKNGNYCDLHIEDDEITVTGLPNDEVANIMQ